MADYSITGDTRLDTSGFTNGISSMTVAAGNLISDLVKTTGTKLAGLAQSSVSVGMNFDASMSQVAATMGTTVDQISNLTKVAKEMGSTTKFTATQAADALNYLALAGYDANKAAEVLPSVLNLAAAGGMDLAYASDLVTDAMASLNIEASKQNVDEFGNKLAMTASKANANVAQLGEAILTVGGTAANLKGGTTELTTALGLLANVGIKSAEGGTHLRNIILSLQSPTDEATKLMQKLGLSVYDSQGKMRGLDEILGDLNAAMQGMTQGQKDSIINQLFNKTDLAAVNGLLAAQGEQWNTLAAQIDAADGAMGQMAETQIDNLQGAMTILSSAFEGLQLAVYDELEPTLTEVVKWGTDCISQLSTALTEGGPEAMLQAAGSILSDLASGIAEQLPGLMSTGVEIITQLAEDIVEATPAMLDTADEVLGALAQGLVDNIPDLIASAAEVIAGFIGYLGDHADEMMTAGLQIIESLIIGITDNLPGLIEAAGATIAKFAAALISHLPKILECAAAIMTTLVDGIIYSLENLAEAALACVAKLVGVWDGSMDEWGHIGENIVQGIINGIASMWNRLTSWVSGLIANLVGAASNAAVNGITQSTSGSSSSSSTSAGAMNRDQRRADALAGKGISNKSWTERQEEAKKAGKETAESIAQSANNAAAAIDKSGKKASSSAKKTTAEVVKSISDTTTEIDGKITRTTENITETLSNGKTQQKQVITETSRQMVDGVLKDIKTITEIDEKGKKTVKQTMETVRELAKTVTATTSGIVDGVEATVQTVTETLTDGTKTQKQVITTVQDEIVDGALVTVQRVKTIAADGTEQVTEQIKESAAESFDGLWKELQDKANTGLLGTFGDLFTAVKNKDWKSIGLWAASAIYGGLTADQKKQIEDFALGMVDKINKALKGYQTEIAVKAWDLGTQICNGLTHGFNDVWQQAQTLGSTLTDIFKGLKAPLSAAATAISNGLQGGLLSSFPTIFAGVASMVGTIGAAFEGMLTAISTALNATVFGIPMGIIVAGAAVALGIAIAAICSRLGGSKKGTPGTGGGSTSGGSSGSGGISGDIDISTGTGSLEDAINANTKALEKTNAALADMIRQAGSLVLSDNMRLGSTVAASGTARVAAAANNYHREGDTNITQNIYSKAQTAADLARETRWEADMARRR